ncbi:uncharacterized protein LOC100967801 isoform X3 [Pan paniscus]|uniref:uncharacterized protein LOC100967801 isoform X3 n=1 Tax=Pan paniscus TaxID=9597 RepID=UPI002436766E|nr:uncharacterized protein LOC100967801 isoform X3 [Pan paniscus]XP_054955228.1 uncharacterized protein LOC100967801 isoform X3 [Pan paniscus]
MSGSPQASYPQTHSFTLKHQEIRTFWNLNMRGIGGEGGTEEESSLGQAGGKLKTAAWPSWVAEVGAAGALADPGGQKSGSFLPSQASKYFFSSYSAFQALVSMREKPAKTLSSGSFHFSAGGPTIREALGLPVSSPAKENKDSHEDSRGSWQLLHFQLPDPSHFPLPTNSNLGPSRGKQLQPSLTPLQMETCAPGCEQFKGRHTGHTLRCLDSFGAMAKGD